MAAEKNLVRLLSVNFVRLTREVLVALSKTGFDIDQTVSRLQDSIWGNDLTPEQMRTLLFGPKGWDDLQMAVLTARYLALPADRLPVTREELETLCRWLMARDGNETLIDTCVRGWAGRDTPLDALTGLVDELWAVRRTDPEFFAAVVRGQHALALAMIAEHRMLPMLDDDRAIRILTRMALIWAAFDCQATAARARRTMTNPMGWLVNGAAVRMRASTLVSVFRPIDRALRQFVDAYRTSGDGGGAQTRPKSRLSAVQDIRAKAADQANHLHATDGPFALDTVVREARVRSIQTANPFLEQVRQDKTDGAFGNKQMSQFWYADLLPLQIVGLAAMRLAQMEQQLETLLRGAIARAREADAQPQVSVPDFHDQTLRPSWKGRSRALADALRSAVLQDADHYSVRKSRARAAGAGEMPEYVGHDDQFIDVVSSFLAKTSRSGPVADGPSWVMRRRVFEELDVAVGKRFLRAP
ncbi:hypothetical protein C8J25_1177 [Sphingomonas faeni]|uniref:Uncharacterized protein n=1 Tax=Sphingomonas faeni TaxID=185950 RepID=A0A2T5TWH3_9SPHN|nr:hypothetical protein [Sphingomonas faeni]PTW43607.1 hypothetical protein C8J25_1177 [Sphingomonas faeni]